MTDAPTRSPRPSVAAPPAGGDAIALSARGVSKGYQLGDADVSVLRGVDLDVWRGEFVAIEGRSGSGKSTLLHILAGLDACDGGTIHAGGVEIGALAAAVSRWRQRIRRVTSSSRIEASSWPQRLTFAALGGIVEAASTAVLVLATAGPDRRLSRVRNREFGFVFQFYHLLPELTAVENVALSATIEPPAGGAPVDPTGRATDLLNAFGMGGRLEHLPSQLSGGERQRVAIARALMNRPAVLFADEPTGNLDPETGRQIMDVLEALHRDSGQTIVMVTHDRSLAREADRVLVLRDGKLEPADADGTG